MANTAAPLADALGRSLLARLSLEDKVRLLTGASPWALPGHQGIGLRPTVLSDGPAGIRGACFDTARPAASLPAPIAMGATWDVELVRQLGAALGAEARRSGVDVVLAPALNLIRSPLSGRTFEFFSEDPWLAARIGSACVAGIQLTGVGACVKHFVGNESETERRTYDARIAEAVLRELYLLPFESSINEAHPVMVMAAYNRVNGLPMTENGPLLGQLLKREWGFDGPVVSDWSATTSTEAAALAGLDLVMPGPDGPWGDRLVTAVRAGAVPEADIDDKVLRVLRMAERVGTLGRGWPEAVASGHPPTGTDHEQRVDPELLRRVAASSFVLLRNRAEALPIEGSARRRILLVGACAIWPRTQGGGSALVLAEEGASLAGALRAAGGGDTEVTVLAGCRFVGPVPAPRREGLRDPRTGVPGVRLEVRDARGVAIHDAPRPRPVVTWWDDLPGGVFAQASTVILTARYRAEVGGVHMIGAGGLGRLALEVDGRRLAEATTLPPAELVGVLSRPPELRVPLVLEPGQEIEVRIVNELPGHHPPASEPNPPEGGRRAPAASGPPLALVRLGIAPAPDEEAMMAAAERAARDASVVVAVVGLDGDGDTEGHDRHSLALPGRQDALVHRMAAANPRTVVVVNAGSPVLMPWVDEVAAVLQVWLPGQAMAEALADVLLGEREAGGRLPVTLPRRERDCPALATEPRFGGLDYSEGLLVGYRGYDREGIEPLFAFGHGLGYTDWEYLDLEPVTRAVAAGDDLEVRVAVRNVGDRAGREVVQLYLEPGAAMAPGVEGPPPGKAGGEPGRPIRILAAFEPVGAAPGDRAVATLVVPGRAFARYDTAARAWVWPVGTWRLLAGRSSRDLRLSAVVVTTPRAG
jgi:beta-glucosidase